jgi:Mn2+/Fe2+ NRAMP family transporter
MISNLISKQWRVRLALFAMIVGPGIITANVDNDAGGIATYSVAGARFGYGLLWVLLPTCFLLILIQEMCNRMGVVTGKGLSALIRERFGLRASFYLMVALVITNIGNSIADFAGVVAGAELFGIPGFLSAPVGGFLLWHVLVKGTYRSVEKLFFVACGFYVCYVISGFLAKPDWSLALRDTVVPRITWDAATFYMVVGIIGTTIAPWMQFYQQASVVEKGIPLKHYAYSRIDTILGGIIVTVVCYFIVLACAATLHQQGVQIEVAADAARALGPIAGEYCGLLFAIGLISASYFGATILPVSTATSVCEAMGWEGGLNKRFTEAPHYYTIISLVVLIGALVALLAQRAHLIRIMLLSQVINGVLLPVVVFFMLRICSDRSIMGDYANGRLFNALSWFGAGVVALLSLAMVVLTVLYGL